MTAQLINQRIPTGSLIYDRRISRYRSAESGNPVNGQIIRDLLGSERSTLENEVNALTDKLIRGDIGISEYQGSIGQSIKDSLINVLVFAAGGNENLFRSPVRRQYFRQFGINLQGVFGDLVRLTERVTSESITESLFRDRASRFALEVFPVYSRAEALRLMSEQGFNEARRSLDPTAKHCPQCVGYSTGGSYIPINFIVPVGHRCYCGGRCHCRVDYRFNPQLPQIGQTQISEFVSRMADRSLSDA